MTLRVGTKWKLQLTINFIFGDNKIQMSTNFVSSSRMRLQASVMRSLVDVAFSLLVASHGINNFFQDFLASSFTGCVSWLSSDNFDRQPGRKFCHLSLHFAHAPC